MLAYPLLLFLAAGQILEPGQKSVITLAGTGLTGNADGASETAEFRSPGAAVLVRDQLLVLHQTALGSLRQVHVDKSFPNKPFCRYKYNPDFIIGNDFCCDVACTNCGAAEYCLRFSPMRTLAFTVSQFRNFCNNCQPTCSNYFRACTPGDVKTLDVTNTNPQAAAGVRTDGPLPLAQFSLPIGIDLSRADQGTLAIVEAGSAALRLVADPTGSQLCDTHHDGSFSPCTFALTDGCCNAQCTSCGPVSAGCQTRVCNPNLDLCNASYVETPPLGFCTDNAVVRSVAMQGVGDPGGVLFDQTDITLSTVFVTSTTRHAVYSVSTTDGSASLLAGSGTASFGFADGTGTSARFQGPTQMQVVTRGQTNYLVIADTNNHRFRTLTIPAAAGSGVVRSLVGGSRPGSADGVGTHAQFYFPKGMAVEKNTMYVADTGNNLVRKVNLLSLLVSTLAGGAGGATFLDPALLFQPARAGFLDGPARSAQFNRPEAVAVFKEAFALGPALEVLSPQHLIIADTGNNRLRALEITDTGPFCDQHHDGSFNPCKQDRSDFCCDFACSFCGPFEFCSFFSPFLNPNITLCNPDFVGGVCRNYFDICPDFGVHTGNAGASQCVGDSFIIDNAGTCTVAARLLNLTLGAVTINDATGTECFQLANGLVTLDARPLLPDERLLCINGLAFPPSEVVTKIANETCATLSTGTQGGKLLCAPSDVITFRPPDTKAGSGTPVTPVLDITLRDGQGNVLPLANLTAGQEVVFTLPTDFVPPNIGKLSTGAFDTCQETVTTLAPQCGFIVTGLQGFSFDGCTSSPNEGGGVTCTCTHTTEFALVLRETQQKDNRAICTVPKLNVGLVILAVLFSIACVAALVQLGRLLADRQGFSFLVKQHLGLVLSSLARIVILGLRGAERAPLALLVVVPALQFLSDTALFTSIAWSSVQLAFSVDTRRRPLWVCLVWGAGLAMLAPSLVIPVAVLALEPPARDTALLLGCYGLAGVTLVMCGVVAVAGGMVVRTARTALEQTRGALNQSTDMAASTRRMISGTVLLALTLSLQAVCLVLVVQQPLLAPASADTALLIDLFYYFFGLVLVVTMLLMRRSSVNATLARTRSKTNGTATYKQRQGDAPKPKFRLEASSTRNSSIGSVQLRSTMSPRPAGSSDGGVRASAPTFGLGSRLAASTSYFGDAGAVRASARTFGLGSSLAASTSYFGDADHADHLPPPPREHTDDHPGHAAADPLPPLPHEYNPAFPEDNAGIGSGNSPPASPKGQSGQKPRPPSRGARSGEQLIMAKPPRPAATFI